MSGNIKIEKIWKDVDFFEVMVTCANENITASSPVYLTNTLVDQLHDEIDSLLSTISDLISWQSHAPAGSADPCFALKMWRKDSTGHVRIEVYLELNDGGDLNKHNCCFYIDTEIGLLYEFNQKLDTIKNGEIGTVISLLE